MTRIDSYKDLETSIEIQRELLKAIDEEIRLIQKLMNSGAPKDISAISYSDMPKGSKVHMSLDRLLEQLRKLSERQAMIQDSLMALEKNKVEIEWNLKKLEGLNYKVMYMKDIEGKGLQQIANELGYSYKHIANISYENRKKIGKQRKINNI